MPRKVYQIGKSYKDYLEIEYGKEKAREILKRAKTSVPVTITDIETLRKKDELKPVLKYNEGGVL